MILRFAIHYSKRQSALKVEKVEKVERGEAIELREFSGEDYVIPSYLGVIVVNVARTMHSR